MLCVGGCIVPPPLPSTGHALGFILSFPPATATSARTSRTLSLPSFCCLTLRPLPIVHPMALPARWPMFCATAWEGVIASQYGLFCDKVKRHMDELGNECWTGGYTYAISSVEWLECARARCPWCRFLAKRFLRRLKRQRDEWPVDRMRITVGRCFWSPW
ncbi:hypothetical protein GY45DRAFT_250575 [Cubamyces sp. BRFM 1775]|nr:hypothetical protein GY45DRAFT_250575 [Cubamyces sp. BRFM 1775]